jgi:arsenic resistance protein ArsH
MGSLTAPTRELRILAQCPHLPISETEDDPETRAKYRPFILDPELEATDWISQLELETAISMVERDLAKTKKRIKVLVLYGSLRKRFVFPSASQAMTNLYAKLLFQTHGF